jgi:hypothetical protein
MKPFILGGVAAFAVLAPLLVLAHFAVVAVRAVTAQPPYNTITTGSSNLRVGTYMLEDTDRIRAAVSREITTPTGTYICHSNVMWTDDNGVAFAQLQDGTNVPCELKK